jgi:hypothetical protein
LGASHSQPPLTCVVFVCFVVLICRQVLEGVAALRERYGRDIVAVLSAMLEPQSEQRLSVRDAHAQFARLLEAVPGTCARALPCCAVLRARLVQL